MKYTNINGLRRPTQNVAQNVESPAVHSFFNLFSIIPPDVSSKRVVVPTMINVGRRECKTTGRRIGRARVSIFESRNIDINLSVKNMIWRVFREQPCRECRGTTSSKSIWRRERSTDPRNSTESHKLLDLMSTLSDCCHKLPIKSRLAKVRDREYEIKNPVLCTRKKIDK